MHLPMKRARYAVDPLQRLRLLEHQLQDIDLVRRAGPRASFHEDLIDIFTSLRDLHTHYVPPEPYRSHTVYLPFLVEECTRDDRLQYVVSKVANGAELDAAFVPGVEVTHWNGTPIGRAIERNAENQGGGNHDARMARGLDAMTIRTLGRTAPPDEDWVDITYRTEAGAEDEIRVRWNTYQPAEESPFGDTEKAVATAVPVGAGNLARLGALGLDAQTTTVNLVRRDLFARGWQAPPTAGSNELATSLPGVLRAKIRHTSIGDVAHIRIFTFLVPDPTEFVEEFVRLVGARPTVGLIVDVRGNGGGDIRAAEQLLQVMTPRHIEPEPTQFIVSPPDPAPASRTRRTPSTCVPGHSPSSWRSRPAPPSRPDPHRLGGRRQRPGPGLLRSGRPHHRRTLLQRHGHLLGRLPGPWHRAGRRRRPPDRGRWCQCLDARPPPPTAPRQDLAAQAAPAAGDLPGGRASDDAGRLTRG